MCLTSMKHDIEMQIHCSCLPESGMSSLLMGPDIEIKDRYSYGVDKRVSQTGAGSSCHHVNTISRCRFTAHACLKVA